MSLWCVQSGRHRLRKLAGAMLCALLTVAIFGCGRTAPEGFWEPSKDDSAGIKAVVEANKAYFRTGLAELAMTMCDTVLPGTTRTILYGEIEGNPYKSRFRLDSMQHVLNTDSYDLEYTFIAGLDTLENETTCTVTMAETIPGVLRMHAWAKTDSIRVDTILVPPAETLRLTVYDSVLRPVSTIIEKPIAGSSVDGCVLKKKDGQWTLWKISGGGRFYAPGPEDAPYILRLFFNSVNNRVDTVNLRPDTLHYGIQRFFNIDDQLLTYTTSDWVKVAGLLTNQGDAYDFLYFNGRRYEFRDTIKFDGVAPGIYRLSVEHIPVQVLWETVGEYTATVWGIPIRVQ